MEKRLALHATLENILGNANVYFQPPESIKIKYPGIVYSLDNIDSAYADNFSYRHTKRYRIVLIDSNPDSDRSNLFLKLPYCSFDRFYTADNLNHWVYNLYF